MGDTPTVDSSPAGTTQPSTTPSVLQTTADPLQKKLHCSRLELNTWRQCLMHRYGHSNLPSDLSVHVETRDFDECTIECNETNIFNPRAIQIAKTIFRISDQENQLVVFTLYIKKREDEEGTLLLQGPACPTFGTREIKQLCPVIANIINCDDKSEAMETEFQEQIASLPFSDPSEETESFEPSVNTSLKTKHGSQAELQPDLNNHSVKRAFRRRSSNRFVSRSVKTFTSPKVTKSLKTLQEHVAYNSFLLQEADNYFQSEMRDVKEQLKNDLKYFVREKIDCIETLCSSLSQRLQKVEVENQKLKTELGEQKKTIAELKKQVAASSCSEFPPLHSSTTRSLTQTPTLFPTSSFSSVLSNTTAPSNVSNKPTRSGKTHLPITSSASERPHHPHNPPVLSHDHRPIFRSVSHDSQQSVNTVPHPLSPENPNPPSSATRGQCASTPVIDPQQVQHTSATPDPSSSPPTPIYSIPVHNRFSQLTPATVEMCSKPIPVHISGEQKSNKPPASSFELLMQTTILNETDFIIVGDSTINKLKPDKMNTGDFSHVQKINTTNLTTSDVSRWLDTLSPNHQISRLILHVGMNDCRGGEIPAEQWKILLTKCTTKFPSATIIASSIIPARGKHLMNPSITNSNKNMKEVCDLLNLVLVNHRATFVAKSNAPKKDLYETPLHPSFKGLLKLARNLKYPTVDFSTPDVQSGHGTAQWQQQAYVMRQHPPSLHHHHPASATAGHLSQHHGMAVDSGSVTQRASPHQPMTGEALPTGLVPTSTDQHRAVQLQGAFPASLLPVNGFSPSAGTSSSVNPVQALTQALSLLQSLLTVQ